MTPFDLVRFAVFAFFGIGLGLMSLTNVMAFMLLRPPKKLGFLWWHVTSISLSFLCIGIVATERSVTKLGDPPGWQSVLTLVGMILYMVAQFLIFVVERKRYIDIKAQQVATAASPPGTYAPEP